MLRIDKSKFNAEQLAQYEELLAIGKADVDPEAAEDEMEEQKPNTPPQKKKTEKAEVADMEEAKKSAAELEIEEMKKSLELQKQELEDFKKSLEIKQYVEMAKKYAPLGKKEEELGPQLYNLKKSDEAAYNAFVGVLDEHLDLVNKSGLFGEVGKSAGASGKGSVEDKIIAKAAEIRKADPTMDYHQSIAKAWEDNPDLFAEYDDEYSRG